MLWLFRSAPRKTIQIVFKGYRGSSIAKEVMHLLRWWFEIMHYG